MSICCNFQSVSLARSDRTLKFCQTQLPRLVVSCPALPTGKTKSDLSKDEGNPFKNGRQSTSEESTIASGNVASTSSTPDKEARLEAMESSIREGRRRQARPIPIRGVNQPASKDNDSSGQYSEWKEWHLFPEGFEQMPLSQKMTELYLGRRGFLFW
jgi:hypothetical protein